MKKFNLVALGALCLFAGSTYGMDNRRIGNGISSCFEAASDRLERPFSGRLVRRTRDLPRPEAVAAARTKHLEEESKHDLDESSDMSLYSSDSDSESTDPGFDENGRPLIDTRDELERKFGSIHDLVPYEWKVVIPRIIDSAIQEEASFLGKSPETLAELAIDIEKRRHQQELDSIRANPKDKAINTQRKESYLEGLKPYLLYLIRERQVEIAEKQAKLASVRRRLFR